MSDEDASEESRYKRLYNKLKYLFWSKSWASNVRRITGLILVGGGICYVPWLTSDALSPDYPVLRVWLVLMGIFLLFAHIVSTVIEKEPEFQHATTIVSLVMFVGLTLFVWKKRASYGDSERPILSATHVHILESRMLVAGLEQEAEVTISNPNRFPLHLVTLGIEISNDVQSASVSIDLSLLSTSELPFVEVPPMPEFGRLNNVPTKNPETKNIILLIYTIPPHGHRIIRIGGSKEFWANLELLEYSKQLEIFHFKSHSMAAWSMLKPTSVAFKYVTNMTPDFVTNFTFKVRPKQP